MAVDLRWHDACSESGAFTQDEQGAGWPSDMTPSQLAKMQRPVTDANRGVTWRLEMRTTTRTIRHGGTVKEFTDTMPTQIADKTPARMAQDTLLDALLIACKNGDLACTATVNRYRDADRPTGLVLLGNGKIRPGDLNWVEETIYRVTALAFATWLHAQGESPSVHISAWFEARGVAWPLVAGAVSDVPSGWAGLVASFKARKKGGPWSEEEKAILRIEFKRRSGWRQIEDGGAWGKDSGVQDAMAQELGLKRQALDRHLGDSPNHAESAFASMRNAFTGTR